MFFGSFEPAKTQATRKTAPGVPGYIFFATSVYFNDNRWTSCSYFLCRIIF